MSNIEVTGPHGHGFDDVAKCLAVFKGETIVFVNGLGNAGDNLINLGTYRLFEILGIRYVFGSIDEVYPGRVIVYSGGGQLVSYYPWAATFLRRNHPVCKALILLPHTVRAHADMIAEMDERCHLFAREDRSHDFVRQHATRAHVHKSHDMAFMLDKEYVERLRWDVSDLYRKGFLRSWATMIIKLNLIAKFRGSTLHALRADCESDSQPTHPLNYDLSYLFAIADMRRIPCENTAKALSAVLRAFREVKTDRLHIAVFSAILGLDVEMHDNNYGKNYDIYDHSMRGRFGKVRFISDRVGLSEAPTS